MVGCATGVGGTISYMLLYPPSPSAPRQSGFTLIELMVTIAIVAILAALAAPSLQAFIVRNTFAGIGNEFQGSLLRARTEAVNKNSCTTMCMSNTGDNTAPSCLTTGNDWQVGWIVFLNPSCDSPTTLTGPAVPEDMILVRLGGSSNYGLLSQRSTPPRRVNFNPRGNVVLAQADEFDLHSYIRTQNDLDYGFNICLDVMGRTRSIPADRTCTNFN
jgi:type IV fimbrial biogenesis protein FimT